MEKIFRSRAPLRLGLAGGGTDVSPNSEQFGGAILNVTISLFAFANIEETNDGQIEFESKDFEMVEKYKLNAEIPSGGKLNLLKGVYNRIQKDFPFTVKGLKIITYVEAPPGSGLGSSSTLVVAIIGAFVEMLNLPLGEYDIAQYAYDIERIDLQLAGGKQDQYATTFGGFNYMEFYKDNKTIVNPLRIKADYIHELENNIVLFYTSTSRDSASIIEQQINNVKNNNKQSIAAMHNLKSQAVMMKEALLRGELDKMGEIFDYGFSQKRNMAEKISNDLLEMIYQAAKKAGASGGKISGAGGGGFMIFYCPSNTRFNVIKTLEQFDGHLLNYTFTKNGMSHWTVIKNTI